MANETIYPFGPGGLLPAGYPVVDDLKTFDAAKPISAKQGVLLDNEIFQMNSYLIYRTDYTENVGWLINSSQQWQKVNGETESDYSCILIPITPGLRYTVYGSTIVALLASSDMTTGETPDFCEGFTSRIPVSSGTLYSFIAPEDAAYLYFLTRTSGYDTSGSIRYSDANFDRAISKIAECIYQINSEKIDTSIIEPAIGWTINGSGKWIQQSENPQNFASILVPVSPGKEYVIIGNTEGSICAILKSATRTANSSADFCDDYPARLRVKRYDHLSFTAPSDAAYVYLCIMSSGSAMNGYLATPKPLYEQLADIGAGSEDVKDRIETAPEYYAWLKMEQMTNIKWTPKKGTIQMSSSTSMFSAGVEQKGMIYSSVSECDKRVGTDVSLHTFMTALNNPYSLMYTECVRYGYSRSAYGVTYYGAKNCGAYFGMVCSGLANYALGMRVPWITNDLMRDLIDSGLVEAVYDQSANGAKRGDMLCSEEHTQVIKDVWRKNGVVTKVLVCHQTQPLAEDLSIMSAEQFNNHLATGGYVIRRWKDLYKNIDYTPSPYVAVGDETPQTVTYNNDICTFAGDMASFAEGDLIYIHCRNLDYPQMELYKDNVLVDTITLASDSRASLTSDSQCYAVNLSNDNLVYGKYKARLKNGNAYSDYTYFEVINCGVSLDEYNIATYSSANAVAVCYYWQRYHDSQGAKIYDMKALPEIASGTFETTPPGSTWPLLKVLFQGDYGRVAAKFLVE